MLSKKVVKVVINVQLRIFSSQFTQVEWGLPSEWFLFDWRRVWRVDTRRDQFLHRQANLSRRDSMVEAKDGGIRFEKHVKHTCKWRVVYKIKCHGRIWISYICVSKNFCMHECSQIKICTYVDWFWWIR